MHWTGRGKEKGRKKSRPKLPPPFPLLCNLLISFQWETGALSPREGGGASLPGRMRGEAAPLLPGRGAQVFLLHPKGEEGGLAAKSLVPCATQPCPAASSRRCLGSAAGGVPSPSVSCPGGPSPPPVLWPCPCPGGGGCRTALPVPLRLRGLHGRILFPRCHWATWHGGRKDRGGALAPDS